MQYLIDPKKGKSSAHLWNGNDSYCKMYSTGGMSGIRQKVFNENFGKPICTMCVNNYIKKHGGLKTSGKI